MNQLQYQIGDLVQVVSCADENDKLAMGMKGKIWKINPYRPSTAYYVKLEVEGFYETQWAFAEYQLQKVGESSEAAIFKKGDRICNQHGLVGTVMKRAEFGIEVLFDVNGTTYNTHFTEEGLKTLTLVTNEEKQMSDTLTKLNNKKLDEDTRLLRKYGIVDKEGSITQEGHDVLTQMVFDQNKEKLVASLKDLEEDEKKEKKSK